MSGAIFGPDDLVARLRTEVTDLWATPLGVLLNEAADEIERLRDRVTDLEIPLCNGSGVIGEAE